MVDPKLEIWRVKCPDGRVKDLEINPDDPTDCQYLLNALRRETAYVPYIQVVVEYHKPGSMR